MFERFRSMLKRNFLHQELVGKKCLGTDTSNGAFLSAFENEDYN
jgi:hypothetical protein